ncbi:MAG: DUF296 domain-containing protein [Elusimicrobia bacterium]|nr:DUF296 domain-containing protein [Elusimicrobiota bacterium]
MKLVKIRIEEGKKLVASLERKLDAEGIKNAAVVSCVGALREFELITIYQNSEKIPPDHFARKFDKKAELLSTGNVTGGKVHLHATMGLEGGEALAGHLVEGVVTYFADVFLIAEAGDEKK